MKYAGMPIRVKLINNFCSPPHPCCLCIGYTWLGTLKWVITVICVAGTVTVVGIFIAHAKLSMNDLRGVLGTSAWREKRRARTDALWKETKKVCGWRPAGISTRQRYRSLYGCYGCTVLLAAEQLISYSLSNTSHPFNASSPPEPSASNDPSVLFGFFKIDQWTACSFLFRGSNPNYISTLLSVSTHSNTDKLSYFDSSSAKTTHYSHTNFQCLTVIRDHISWLLCYRCDLELWHFCPNSTQLFHTVQKSGWQLNYLQCLKFSWHFNYYRKKIKL